MEEVRIPYKPRIFLMLLVILFFGGCAAILGFKAFENDRGMVLNGLLTFSVSGASIFYWCLSGLSVLFVLAGFWGFYNAITSRKELVLTDVSVSSPRSAISSQIITIQYDEVDFLEMQDIYRERLLTVHAKDGRKLVIAQSLLPSKDVFEHVVATVTKNAGAYVAG